MSRDAEWPDGWAAVEDRAALFERQVRRELSWRHPLKGRRLRALAHRLDSDDVLFEIAGEPRRWAVVHLTWRRHWWSAEWPWTVVYDALAAWRHDVEADDREADSPAD